jgi:hypothetical protein
MQAGRVGQAVHRETHSQFGALAGMAADQRRFGLVQHFQRARHEMQQQVLHFRFEAERDADDRQRGLRLTAHGEDVAQAVVGGDLPEHIRIVDQGTKEIWSMIFPGGTVTAAASSGASSPSTTSGRANGRSWLSASCSMVLPTLAPQPPQRMAVAASSSIAAASATPVATTGCPAGAISGSAL